MKPWVSQGPWPTDGGSFRQMTMTLRLQRRTSADAKVCLVERLKEIPQPGTWLKAVGFSIWLRGRLFRASNQKFLGHPGTRQISKWTWRMHLYSPNLPWCFFKELLVSLPPDFDDVVDINASLTAAERPVLLWLFSFRKIYVYWSCRPVAFQNRGVSTIIRHEQAVRTILNHHYDVHTCMYLCKYINMHHIQINEQLNI